MTFRPQIVALTIAWFLFSFAGISRAGAPEAPAQICEAAADASLAAQNYHAAVELHRRLLRLNGDSALAHYHLGFAYGLLGEVSQEIDEYRKAIRLGLSTWDLFMNLGLAYCEDREPANGIAALKTAVALGPAHAETHFNLAVVCERENRLKEALAEIIAALVLSPRDLDAANTDAIICARMGNVADARRIWSQLIEAAPDYTPARVNLDLLDRACGPACRPETGSQTELLTQSGN